MRDRVSLTAWKNIPIRTKLSPLFPLTLNIHAPSDFRHAASGSSLGPPTHLLCGISSQQLTLIENPTSRLPWLHAALCPVPLAPLSHFLRGAASQWPWTQPGLLLLLPPLTTHSVLASAFSFMRVPTKSNS